MKVTIDFEIQFTTPFHSGTGLPSGLIHRGVRKDFNGLLYLPATTYKGILRDKVEAFFTCCYPDSNSGVLSPNDSFNNRFMDYYDQTDPGVIEKLFGNNTRQGNFHFSNLQMVPEDKDFFRGEHGGFDTKLQVESRTQTRIARSLNTVASGALFKSEYGLKDLRFSGSIRGFLKQDEALELENNAIPLYKEIFFLLGGMRLMDRLAGNKSTGMGSFIYTNLNLKLGRFSLNREEINVFFTPQVLKSLEIKD